MKIEAVAVDELYFSHITDNKGREYKSQVFRRFDENCKLNLAVIDNSGLIITPPERTHDPSM
ncbi:MAG: hypothetical protein ACXVI3_06485 [Halobacteriota archaeon]